MSYPFSEEQYIAAIRDRIAYIGTDDPGETEQIADMREDMQTRDLPLTDNIKSLDSEIIKHAGKVGNVVNGYDEDFWAWNLDKVASGTFPIDNLPAHVRDLAKELYYGARA